MRMKLLYYNCTFALFIFRLHKLGIEAHAYAHYTSLLCFALHHEAEDNDATGQRLQQNQINFYLSQCRHQHHYRTTADTLLVSIGQINLTLFLLCINFYSDFY